MLYKSGVLSPRLFYRVILTRNLPTFVVEVDKGQNDYNTGRQVRVGLSGVTATISSGWRAQQIYSSLHPFPLKMVLGILNSS
jgi:hypothetical protein